MEDTYFKVFYNYQNVPKFIRKPMRKWYMKNRHDAIEIYHENIDLINDIWGSTGKKFAFGEYLEDLNPDYTFFVKVNMEAYLTELNKKFRWFKYEIDEYGDIVGTIPMIKGSRLRITLEKV